MQWTREGTHNVLQIRASMVSQEWSEKWLEFMLPESEKQLNNYLFHIKYLRFLSPWDRR